MTDSNRRVPRCDPDFPRSDPEGERASDREPLTPRRKGLSEGVPHATRTGLTSHAVTGRSLIVVAVVAAALTAILMGPVAIHPNSLLYGVGDDGVSAAAGIAQHRRSLDTGGLMGKLPMLLGAPFPYADDFAAADPLWWLAGATIARVLSPVGAVNVLIFVSFVATAVAVYALLAAHGLGRAASTFGALLYTYSPIRLAEAQEHFTLLDDFWFAILLGLLLKFGRRPRASIAVGIGLCLGLTTLDNPYLAYMSGIVAGFWISIIVIHALFHRHIAIATRVLSFSVLALLTTAAVLIPTQVDLWNQVIRYRNGSGASALIRPLADLDDLSLRWWHFFLPPPDNPFVSWIVSKLSLRYGRTYQSIDQSTTIGYTALALAIAGAWYALRRWVFRQKLPQGGNPRIEVLDEHYARRFQGPHMHESRPGSLAAIALVSIASGILFGLPPLLNAGPIRLPTPSYFMHAIFPQIRTTSRFDLIIQLGIAVLSSFGFARVLAATSSWRCRPIVIGALSVLVAVEYTNFPPWRSVRLWPPPKVYSWLATLTESEAGVVANYPLVSSTWDRTSMYSLYAYAVHGHRLINGVSRDTTEDYIRANLEDILNPTTPASLAALGVKTVTVDTQFYRLSFGNARLLWLDGDRGLSSELPAGLTSVYRDEASSAYSVRASPAPVVAGIGPGFGAAELRPDGREWRWMGADATAWIYNVTRVPVVTALWTAVHNNQTGHKLEWAGFEPVVVPTAEDSYAVAIVTEAAPGMNKVPLRVQGNVKPLGDASSGSPQVSIELRTLEPAPIREVNARFSEAGQTRVTLEGASLDACEAQAGSTVDVALLWTVRAPTVVDQTAFLHVVDSSGNIVAQADALPNAGSVGTSRSRPGTRVSDVHSVRLPTTLRPGRYALRAGLYELKSGKRLDSEGGGDSVTVGGITVMPESSGPKHIPCDWTL